MTLRSFAKDLKRLWRKESAPITGPMTELAPPQAPEPAATAPSGNLLDHFFCEFDARALLRAYAHPKRKPKPGFVTNFLGVEIAPKIYPPILSALSGSLEDIPNPGNWHADIAEWAAALRSVDCASESYRLVELGCGWGCWMVNMGAAARRRGLQLDLRGIEGDAGHLAHARETLLHNGFRRGEFTLLHGIAAPKAGLAIFPAPEQGSAHWGGAPEFDPSPERLAKAREERGLQILNCYTLEQISGNRPIDLLHIDIQGGEADYVEGNSKSMAALVKRVLIGTHSREIEGRLFAHFQNQGWLLEMERPAYAPPINGIAQIRIDGVQCWRNPAFKA